MVSGGDRLTWGAEMQRARWTSGGAGAGRAEGTDERRCGEVRSTAYGVVHRSKGLRTSARRTSPHVARQSRSTPRTPRRRPLRR